MNPYLYLKSLTRRLFKKRNHDPYIPASNKFEGNIIVNKINVRPIYRQSQDIQKWRNALIYAEGTAQQRKQLYDLYSEIMLDGYLKEAIAKRVRAITNRDLVFTIKGKEVDDVVELTEKTFFGELLKELMNSRFWGHSLVELNWGRQKGWTKLVDRRHVKPRFGIVTVNAHDTEGIDYRSDEWAKHTIEAGDDEDLGLILEACQYVIYKRGNFGDWAEFAEVFGMPFRWATYNNPETREALEEAMDKAGSAGYVVAPEDANIQFLNNTQGQGNDIFKTLRDACNEEITISILGQTMTTNEAKSSGYAQSKTHMQVQSEIHKDDRKYILRILNEKLTPYLESIGFKVKGGKWHFKDEDNLSLLDKLKIAKEVSKEVPVGMTYWYETFGIPKPSANDLPPEREPEPSTSPKDDEPEPKEGSKKKA